MLALPFGDYRDTEQLCCDVISGGLNGGSTSEMIYLKYLQGIIAQVIVMALMIGGIISLFGWLWLPCVDMVFIFSVIMLIEAIERYVDYIKDYYEYITTGDISLEQSIKFQADCATINLAISLIITFVLMKVFKLPTKGGVSEEPIPTEKFALGLETYLDDFATQQGAQTYKSYPETDWRILVCEKLQDPNVQIKFNLTGIDDVWSSISRAAAGQGGATDWELLQIKMMPEIWDRITWYNNGQVVANPFK